MGCRGFIGTILLCTLALGTGCGKAKSNTASKAAASAPLPPRAGAMVSETAAEDFAVKFIEAVSTNNLTAAAPLVDWHSLLETSWSGLGVSDKLKAGFEQGFLSSVNQPGGVFPEIAGKIAAGGRLDLLRVREREGRRTAVMRLLLNPGVNYFEFALEQKPNGSVQAVDFYVYSTSEWFSTTLRRFCLPLAAHEDRSLADRLLGNDQMLIKHWEKVNVVIEAGKTHRWQNLLDGYHALPTELQKDKNLLLLRYRAAMELQDETKLVEAIEDFRRYHRRDPCLAFFSIDYYALKGNYARSLEAVGVVDESVGGDDYLEILRADILSRSEDFPAAEAAAMKITGDEILAPFAYSTLFSVAVRAQQPEKAVKWLDELHTINSVTPAEVRAMPENAAFIETDEFKAWAAKVSNTVP